MHEQAQLRLKKDEVEKLGADVYVVLAMDLYRTKVFKEENLVLSTFQNPFTKEPSLVFGTALSDPAGYASALYGVSRKCLRGQAWVENDPCWFVIDRKGTLTCAYPPNFSGATFYEKDIDRVLEELSKAAHE
jgi:peroxiredoxin